MNYKPLFLILAILSAISLMFVAGAFATGNSVLISISMIIWLLIIGGSFILKKRLSKKNTQ